MPSIPSSLLHFFSPHEPVPLQKRSHAGSPCHMFRTPKTGESPFVNLFLQSKGDATSVPGMKRGLRGLNPNRKRCIEEERDRPRRHCRC
ncbi:hypothetical protein TRIP_B50671 [uncultured Desulfatiglans sp.]|uniref:Uncharacterized protein n=1 Tax=Uncultured Desulfatiglans sp. TaxID=1748965 RepID=A0A653AJB4_UNCDX|nr:hypothetical protein TRIP_B50671 [uncultured Desulfatiglans sp.]